MSFSWGLFWNDWMLGVRVTYYPAFVREVGIGIGPLHISFGNRSRYMPTVAVIAKAMKSDEGRATLRDVGLEPR